MCTFSLSDLTCYWPITELDRLSWEYELDTWIVRPECDPAGFCMLQEKIKKETVYWLVPSHYFNAVSIISSKIAWLQYAATYQCPKNINREQITASCNMRDGYRRHLIFTHDVQNHFYKTVEKQFCKPGSAKHKCDNDPTFHEPVLNSWLYIEYTTGMHQLFKYHKLHPRLKYIDKHLLNLTLSGKYPPIWLDPVDNIVSRMDTTCKIEWVGVDSVAEEAQEVEPHTR